MRPGETLLIRYVRDGVVRGARPTRVVGERNGYLASWLPAGTIVANPVLANGEPLRSVPIEERFTVERGALPALQPWRGEGILMLTPDDAAHSVWVFWHDDGSFWGFYVNLEQRHRRNGNTIDTRDHVLDLECERPRQWQWKDEDELVLAVEHGFVTPELAAEIRAEGERVAGMIERWEPPFSDGWENWRPDPAWPLPVLPDGWAQI
jgi:hypothetical protein